VLTAALFVRFRSRQDHTFAEKMLSAMRNKFGGHVNSTRRRVRPIDLSTKPVETVQAQGTARGRRVYYHHLRASGDLTTRKLLPALYNLRRSEVLPMSLPCWASLWIR